jgi:hypothetical protein
MPSRCAHASFVHTRAAPHAPQAPSANIYHTAIVVAMHGRRLQARALRLSSLLPHRATAPLTAAANACPHASPLFQQDVFHFLDEMKARGFRPGALPPSLALAAAAHPHTRAEHSPPAALLPQM